MANRMIRDLMRQGGGGQADMPMTDVAGAQASGEPEGHGGAVELFDNALSDLQQLAQLVPEVNVIAARLEALRPKAEQADQGGGVGLPAATLPTGGLPEKLA